MKVDTAQAAGCIALDLQTLTDRARAAGIALKALSHEGRFLLLCLLASRERSVGELCNRLELRQTAVSQQLARLRIDGMVKTRREGKTVYYSIADEDVRRVVSVLYEVYCRRTSAP